MQHYGMKEGFSGEKVFRLSRQQIQAAERNDVFHGLYVTDIGYFPLAMNHLVDRTTLPSRESILIYCIGGAGWFEVEEQRHSVEAGQFFVIPAGVAHRYGSDMGWQVYWVHVGGALTEKLLEMSESSLAGASRGPDSTEAVEVFEKMIRRAEEAMTVDSVNSLHFTVWHLLGMFILSKDGAGETGLGTARLDACIQFMKEHISERLTLKDMAEHAGYSVSHFIQVFRERTGYAPVDFYLQLKIQYAAKVLATTPIKVKDTARLCGYENPYYFSRLFKKTTGYSPRGYRHQFKV